MGLLSVFSWRIIIIATCIYDLFDCFGASTHFIDLARHYWEGIIYKNNIIIKKQRQVDFE